MPEQPLYSCLELINLIGDTNTFDGLVNIITVMESDFDKYSLKERNQLTQMLKYKRQELEAKRNTPNLGLQL